MTVIWQFVTGQFSFNTLGREVPTVELYPRATQSVIEGGSAIFQCRPTGVPPPTIQWSRPNKEPLSSRVEQLTNGVLRYTGSVIQ